jgi:1-deoxy-D-xylulose-5-phosphate reductoisomerase
MTRQRVCILGSTGSVGTSTLEVLSCHPDRYEVFALTAHSRVDELIAQCRQWQPRFAVLGQARDAQRAQAALRAAGVRTEVLHGDAALVAMAEHSDVDSVMAAIVGAAGLAPCLAAARAGKRLMLANKEALVVGGGLFMQAVAAGGATLLPIDSEHSAIFQCLPEDRSAWAARVDHIILTASGGPFRTRAAETLHEVTPEQACAHPNWVMGRKISVDSATMMNKALEVIEARWLFDLAPERIRVVLHPQSIVHSMVVCRDESVLAQLGTPDMKVPIAVGLAHPDRITSGAQRLNFLELGALTFESADRARFPSLGLAYDALNAPEGSTAVLNAANEVAVQAFLDRRIRFTDIHRVNAGTMARVSPRAEDVTSLVGLLALDERARQAATALSKECST